MGVDEFAEALGADIIIENLARPGSLSIPEILWLSDWFDRRQEQLRRAESEDT